MLAREVVAVMVGLAGHGSMLTLPPPTCRIQRKESSGVHTVALVDPDGPFRIRAMRGDYKHEWLFRMGVSQGGVHVDVMEWAGIFHNRAQYKFTPDFLPSESAAHRFYTREVAEIHQAILKEQGIESEIVPVSQRTL